MSRRGERISLFGYRVGWRAVRTLPAPVAYRLFDGIADIAYRRGGRSVQRLRSNYATVRPELSEAELDALTRAGMRSYLRYWCDAFRLPDVGPDTLAAVVRSAGEMPALRASIESGKGAVGFLGHLGNWDIAGAWAGHWLHPVTTVAERLKPEELYEEFLSYRSRLGMTILPLTGQSGVFVELIRAVRGGGFVPLLADRDLTDKGVVVDFCGSRASMAAGPAALALATGAPLFPVRIFFEPHPDPPRGSSGYRVVLDIAPAAPVPDAPRPEQIRAMTQYCADAIGASVREHTEDWHMLQRVFLHDLTGPRGDGTDPPAASGEAVS